MQKKSYWHPLLTEIRGVGLFTNHDVVVIEVRLGAPRSTRHRAYAHGGVESGLRLLTRRDVEGDEKTLSVSIMLRALSQDGVMAGE